MRGYSESDDGSRPSTWEPWPTTGRSASLLVLLLALGACSKGDHQEPVGTTQEALSATDTDDVRAAVLDAFCYCESFVPSFRRFTEGAAECAGDEWLAEYVEEQFNPDKFPEMFAFLRRRFRDKLAPRPHSMPQQPEVGEADDLSVPPDSCYDRFA